MATLPTPLFLSAAFASLVACPACPAAAPPAGSAAPASSDSGGDIDFNAPRVANADHRSADRQPDWNGIAGELRARVQGELAVPAPDPASSCEAMLDAAERFYLAIETDPKDQEARREELASTRDADLAACLNETSVEASQCVTLLLDRREAEFAWLLDQCSRAFPRSD